MKILTSFLSLLLALTLSLSAQAQTRSTELTIAVNSVLGDDLTGQPVTLMHTGYQVSYGSLKLDAQGQCKVKVYAGEHNLSVERDGFEPLSYDFTVAEGQTQQTVTLSLTEKTRQPFALAAQVSHDVFDGSNQISLTWNHEAPAFFDDFESYDPFSISFGQWTGIDADLEAAAPLLGTYPNRGVMQYAQIINPLTVTPTWWYDYPILRPYSGQQYVGFTRTNSGNQNDDWLISPVITVGTDNVLQFMGKAGDQFPERFMVYVTEQTDNPVQADFTRLDQDNYETADHRGWHQYSYDLSQYAGRQVKIAIRCISHYNRYGSFMLMIDDFYVGQATHAPLSLPATRRMPLATRRSPANPNEQFVVYLDGVQAGTTDGYEMIIPDVPAGQHTVGVQATYIAAQSEPTTIQVDVPAGPFAAVTFSVTANSVLSPDGQQLLVTSMATSETYELTIADGRAELPSLPYGQYVLNVAEGAFLEYQQTITVSGDATVTIALTDRIVTPYNITATADEEGRYTLRWNQELGFTDSFEDYDDFAVGSFGEWKSYDQDQRPVYPINLQGSIVAFPGSGSQYNPMPVAPMVFNPWSTTPPMLPTDQAIAAPTGNKSIIFFSAQQARNDKWLVSPLFDIREGYQLQVKAKGYSPAYPESMEFCVSQGGDQPSDFTALSTVPQLSSEQWSLYETDLSDFAGQTVRLAVHYTSYDAFMAQIDDFTVGPAEGEAQSISYGNVLHFDILLDGEKIGETATPVFTLPLLSSGSHVVGIRAVYQGGQSEVAEYSLTVTAIAAPYAVVPAQPAQYFNLHGQQLTSPRAGGIYLLRRGDNTIKIRK